MANFKLSLKFSHKIFFVTCFGRACFLKVVGKEKHDSTYGCVNKTLPKTAACKNKRLVNCIYSPFLIQLSLFLRFILFYNYF